MSPAPLVVLPVYNEAENLEQVVAGIRSASCDVLVVDDNSPDGSGRLADELNARDPRISVIHRPGKLGLGSAYVAGFRWGLDRGYELLLEMDADRSHSPEYLPALLQSAGTGGGLAIGSRYIPGGAIRGWGLRRLLLSRAANVYVRTVLGIAVHDSTSGFRCYTARALTAVGLDQVSSQGYSFQIEMVVRTLAAGMRVTEVPIVFEDRVAGHSKVSRAEISRALLTVLQLRLAGFRARAAQGETASV